MCSALGRRRYADTTDPSSHDAVLKERMAAAESHAAELQRQLDAGSGGIAASGVSPSKASARIALVCVRDFYVYDAAQVESLALLQRASCDTTAV